MSHPSHPGRSLEFLSRLHDGELSPAERAHFESHRAHCAECRKAAAEFEDALSFFRTSGTSPASGDLAARILRRLEAANPRRSPFGVVFGIDVKWAGAFTAALIAVILGYSLLDRPAARPSLRISFVQPTPGASPVTPALTALIASRSLADAESSPQRIRETKVNAGKGTGNLAAPPPPAAARESAAKPASSLSADRLASARTAPEKEEDATASTRTSQRALAKAPAAAAVRAEAQVVAPAAPVSVRVTVTALDDYGAPPAVIGGTDLLGAANRGDWLVVVGANGVPIEAARQEGSRKDANPSIANPAAEALEKLRFEIGAQARRLLVRVE